MILLSRYRDISNEVYQNIEYCLMDELNTNIRSLLIIIIIVKLPRSG